VSIYRSFLGVLLSSLALVGCASSSVEGQKKLRLGTYNVQDVRTVDLLRTDQPRVNRTIDEIIELNPDIMLLNEIQYDGPGDPWKPEGEPDGSNADRLAKLLDVRSNGSSRYEVIMLPSNTGIASGFDFDNNGDTVTVVPDIPGGGPDGSQGRQTPEGRAYGGDAFGFGMFPGQYAMALLVREGLDVDRKAIRTFQMFRWKDLPGALIPMVPDSDQPWYSPEEWDIFRLSSKSHWDIPVRVTKDLTIHVLASHPTPPAFDGPERRNKLRNHDEIRFWYEYLAGADFIVDDAGQKGGLQTGASFVIVGDLNADIDEGSSVDNPIATYIASNPRINTTFVPQGDRTIEGLDPDDTAWWGFHADYVLPSMDLRVIKAAVHRHNWTREEAPQDHFPVWVDVDISGR